MNIAVPAHCPGKGRPSNEVMTSHARLRRPELIMKPLSSEYSITRMLAEEHGVGSSRSRYHWSSAGPAEEKSTDRRFPRVTVVKEETFALSIRRHPECGQGPCAWNV